MTEQEIELRKRLDYYLHEQTRRDLIIGDYESSLEYSYKLKEELKRLIAETESALETIRLNRK